MFSVCWAFVLLFPAVSGGSPGEDLPSWITEAPGYQNLTEVDSIKRGNGSLEASTRGSQGWLVFLNEKAGHGIEVEVKNLSLDADAGDFLLLSTWPLTSDFKQIKLFTGNFNKPLRKIRIPNAKMFFLLYSVSGDTRTPRMALEYRRYGSSLELAQLPTENPAKKKEIVYEVQLKGMAPEEYVIGSVLDKVKLAIRAAAQRYCTGRNITFNSEIPTEEMVLIHRITFCPFEWPERHICASLMHSVFVSGFRIPDEEIILDYQLTADHLKVMWSEETFPELQELGLTVFHLPATYSTVAYWTGIIGLVIVSSMILTFICWKANKTEDASLDANSTASGEVRKIKRSKLKLARHQRVPSFMYVNPTDARVEELKKTTLKSANEEPEEVFKPGLPIKNYFGGILFGANRAYEDDEDKPSETPTKSRLV